MAAIMVQDGDLAKALKKLGKIVAAEGIHTRSADVRRYRSRAEVRRIKRRMAAAKARKRG